jgi:hypothetical protein
LAFAYCRHNVLVPMILLGKVGQHGLTVLARGKPLGLTLLKKLLFRFFNHKFWRSMRQVPPRHGGNCVSSPTESCGAKSWPTSRTVGGRIKLPAYLRDEVRRRESGCGVIDNEGKRDGRDYTLHLSLV